MRVNKTPDTLVKKALQGGVLVYGKNGLKE